MFEREMENVIAATARGENVETAVQQIAAELKNELSFLQENPREFEEEIEKVEAVLNFLQAEDFISARAACEELFWLV